MKSENIPADIKSKSLKEARDEIDVILAKLESKNLEFNTINNEYKRLILLNASVEPETNPISGAPNMLVTFTKLPTSNLVVKLFCVSKSLALSISTNVVPMVSIS